MLFQPIPLSTSVWFLGEGQRVQIGTVGTTPVFLTRHDRKSDVEIGDLAGIEVNSGAPRAIAAAAERLAEYLQKLHPEIFH